MANKNLPKGQSVEPSYMSLKVADDMYDLIAAEADRRNLPMNETIAQILGEYFKRPDLGYVPRQNRRPRRNKPIAS